MEPTTCVSRKNQATVWRVVTLSKDCSNDIESENIIIEINKTNFIQVNKVWTVFTPSYGTYITS